MTFEGPLGWGLDELKIEIIRVSLNNFFFSLEDIAYALAKISV